MPCAILLKRGATLGQDEAFGYLSRARCGAGSPAHVLAALAATVRKIHRVLSLVVALAVRDGQLTRNLAPEVNLPRVGLTRARLPTAWFALAAPMVGAR
jgi:hypothetical protein